MNVWLVLSAAGVLGMTTTAIEDAKFTPVSPQRPQGAQMAVLWGDPTTGPSAMLLRMSKGAGAMHVHTADYHCVVIEGTMQHWTAREAESAKRR